METSLNNRSNNHSNYQREIITTKAHTSQLLELFEEQLKNTLWSERALINAIPRMISLATSEDLILELTDNLKQTHEHITRLAKIFRNIEKKPTTIKCETMERLIAEASDMMEDCEKGAKCDAGIIAAAQKIEHYEIATYGTLRQFAETLGLREAERLLMITLKEEKEADYKLTDVAIQKVNMMAASVKMKELSNQMEHYE